MTITHSDLIARFGYDPETGRFFQRSDGASPGWINSAGRWVVNVDGVINNRARFIWFYVTGQWPDGEIDHKNRNRLDDRWENLRKCTRSQNQANAQKYKNNRSGAKGVHYRMDMGKWRAIISVKGRNRSLGHFATLAEAAAAHRSAAQALHGEFAA